MMVMAAMVVTAMVAEVVAMVVAAVVAIWEMEVIMVPNAPHSMILLAEECLILQH